MFPKTASTVSSFIYKWPPSVCCNLLYRLFRVVDKWSAVSFLQIFQHGICTITHLSNELAKVIPVHSGQGWANNCVAVGWHCSTPVPMGSLAYTPGHGTLDLGMVGVESRSYGLLSATVCLWPTPPTSNPLALLKTISSFSFSWKVLGL